MVEHVSRLGKVRNTNEMLVRKTEKRRPNGGSEPDWENN
jgi:hypothetical protein